MLFNIGLWIAPFLFFSLLASAQLDSNGKNQFCQPTRDTDNKQNIKMAYEVKTPPPSISSRFNNKEIVFEIDLDGDSKNEYLVQDNKRLCVFDSSEKLKNCTELDHFRDNFLYCFFVQLDSSPMLELFMFSGWEDSSNYKLYKFDNKWKLKLISEILPVIESKSLERTGLYWGYPWDIGDLKIVDGLPVATLNHGFGRCKDNSLLPNGHRRPECIMVNKKDQYKLSFLFDGTPTQGGGTGKYTENLERYKPIKLKKLLAQRSKIKRRLKKK